MIMVFEWLEWSRLSELFFTQARRLVTDQYVLGGKVVRKVRLVGAVYLVDCLEGQCGQVGQVVGILASSSQDDISNTGYNGDCILRYECHYAGNEKMV